MLLVLDPGAFINFYAGLSPCSALPFTLVVNPFALVHYLPVRIKHRTESILAIICPGALVFKSIWKVTNALTVLDALHPLARESLVSLGIKGSSEAMPHHIEEHAHVPGPIIVVTNSFTVEHF